MDTVLQDGGELMQTFQTIITESTDTIESAVCEEDRKRICEEGNKRVEEWIVIFDPLKVNLLKLRTCTQTTMLMTNTSSGTSVMRLMT